MLPAPCASSFGQVLNQLLTWFGLVLPWHSVVFGFMALKQDNESLRPQHSAGRSAIDLCSRIQSIFCCVRFYQLLSTAPESEHQLALPHLGHLVEPASENSSADLFQHELEVNTIGAIYCYLVYVICIYLLSLSGLWAQTQCSCIFDPGSRTVPSCLPCTASLL